MISTKDKKLAIYEWFATLKDDSVIELIFAIMHQQDAAANLTDEEKELIDKRLEKIEEEGLKGISFNELRAKMKNQYGF